METRIALFQKKEVRKTIHENEWWFVITDVVVALTDSVNPTDYLKKMRSRDPSLTDAFKGGDSLSPPFIGVSYTGWAAENALLEHRGHLPPDPVHPQSQGRALQALAGAGGV